VEGRHRSRGGRRRRGRGCHLTRIGITGSYGGLNVGDEAILTCLVQGIGAQVPGAQLVIYSRNAEHTRENYDVDKVVPVRELTREEVTPDIEELDLLILGGGGILFDGEVLNFVREVQIAQRLGIPTFAASIGAGPLDRSESRTTTRDVLNGMSEITVRDVDAKRLLEEVGVELPITVNADPAWLLQAQEFSDEMLQKEGIDPRGRHIGFSVREPGNAAPGLDESAYHHLIADAADFACLRYETDIVFVPMERGDIRHAHQVIAQMTYAERAKVLTGSYTPAQILGLVSRFKLTVSMRLHFLIFCGLSGVPFLPLPYAQKVSSLARAMGLPGDSMIQEGRAGPLLASIDRLWDLRDERRKEMAARVPELQEKARATMNSVARLLEEE